MIEVKTQRDEEVVNNSALAVGDVVTGTRDGIDSYFLVVAGTSLAGARTGTKYFIDLKACLFRSMGEVAAKRLVKATVIIKE